MAALTCGYLTYAPTWVRCPQVAALSLHPAHPAHAEVGALLSRGVAMREHLIDAVIGASIGAAWGIVCWYAGYHSALAVLG